MRNAILIRLSTLCLTSFLLIGASAGCGKSVGQAIDDTTITTRVKTALLNDPDVAGTRIDVDTFRGVVTLSGAVKSKAEETKAVQLAQRTPGVTDVKSTLQLVP